MLGEIRRIYQRSLKPADSLFNLYFARPLAAPIVMLLARTRVTPNQITFVSFGVMLIAGVLLALVPGWLGLVLGVVAVELSYILDCVDGQLARVTGRTSPVGSELDFLMDELKAFVLVGALGLRWYWYDDGGVPALYLAGGTLIIIGWALCLTKFVRSAEYAEATGTVRQGHGQSAGEAGQRKGALWPIKMVARFISQYPACLPIFAAVDRLDVFLWAYGAVHVLYVAQTALVLVLKLGRFAPASENAADGSSS